MIGEDTSEYREYLKKYYMLIKQDYLPSYSEYLKTNNIMTNTTTQPPIVQAAAIVEAPIPLSLPHNLPTISLCKGSPEPSGDIYGHLYCISMLAFWVLLLASLIIYQLRSVLWLKGNLPNIKKKENLQNLSDKGNGQSYP